MEANKTLEYNESSIYVAEGEWDKIENGTLTTDAVSACTVVAVHDSDLHIAYLGHFRFLEREQSEEFDSMLQQAVDTARTLSSLKVSLTGATLLGHEFYDELTLEEREIYKTKVEEKGILNKNINEIWLDDLTEITELSFDATTGKLRTTVSPIDQELTS